MARDGEDVDGIVENPTTDDGEADNATITRIMNLKSFLLSLDDSLDKNDDKMKDLNEMLHSLPPDQINVRTNDYSEGTLLHVAVRRGLVWAAKTLLNAGASVSEQGWRQYQPLHTACRTGNRSLVELLLKYNADIRAVD